MAVTCPPPVDHCSSRTSGVTEPEFSRSRSTGVSASAKSLSMKSSVHRAAMLEPAPVWRNS